MDGIHTLSPYCVAAARCTITKNQNRMRLIYLLSHSVSKIRPEYYYYDKSYSRAFISFQKIYPASISRNSANVK